MDAAHLSRVGVVSDGQAHGARLKAQGPDAIRRVVATVVDPEIPVLTIEDLGVLRGVAIDDDGTVVVTITPTYSGCPAMQLMEDQIALTLDLEGIGPYRIETTYSPAWTTDWMTDEAKEKLRSVGIAPPNEASGLRPPGLAEGSRRKAQGDAGTVPPDEGRGEGTARRGTSRGVGGLQQGDATEFVLCPRCSSDDTRTVSEFGSTACKALMVCSSCGEPFDLFKRLA